MQQISKNTFLDLLENDETFEFLGYFDGKLYARQTSYASNIPSKQRPNFRLVWCNV